MCVYTDSWAVASGLADAQGRNLSGKEHDWEIGDKEIWGRVWASSSLNGQKT